MLPTLSVLLLSDSFEDLWPSLASSVGTVLRTAPSAAELRASGGPAAVMVAAGGMEQKALEEMRALRQAVAAPIAVVGAERDHRLASALLHAGASDYFAMPDDLSVLHAWIVEQVRRATDSDRAAEVLVEERERLGFEKIVGRSADLAAALERTRRVIAHGKGTVLLTGETGTGKDLFAEAIHFNGPRAGRPFVEVNCGAIPGTLMEAELFGFEKGAFTGAETAKPGLFELANGGTLFLDEIAELPLALQAKLLKALDEKRIRRLGGAAEVEVDVRLIAATHADLAERVRQGTFREDLYFRLHVIPVHLPPLRERGEDVLLLTEHFLTHFSREYDLPRPTLDSETVEALLAYPWPGNVRELKNVVERAVVLGEAPMPEAVSLEVEPRAPALSPNGSPEIPFPADLESIERAVARATLKHCRGNKSRAAEILRVSPKRLYSLLGAEDRW